MSGTATSGDALQRCCGRGALAMTARLREMQRSAGASQTLFLGVCALLLLGSAWLTISWSSSMAAVEEMAMPGGWTMSMAWMRMPGQSWLDAAASFLGMWSVMMVAMMLPSLVPMLWRFRCVVGAKAGRRVEALTVLVGVSYFLVWSSLGALVYSIGVPLAALAMQHAALSRAVPLAGAVTMLLAGALQFTAWKARHLACCRGSSLHLSALRASAVSAMRHGATLARHCIACCAAPMAVLMVAGVMDLRAMALVTLAITLERVAQAGERVAKAVGVLLACVGVILLAQAATALG